MSLCGNNKLLRFSTDASQHFIVIDIAAFFRIFQTKTYEKISNTFS